jgi:hypothetical protein
MAEKNNESRPLTPDRCGRRRIKDRRFWVQARQTPERRTGLKRRSGWERRLREGKLYDRAE